MSNQFQHHDRLEQNSHGEVRVNQDVVRDLSRAAYSDLSLVSVNDTNTCSDNLPSCQFAPISRREQRQAYVREVAAPLFEGLPPLISYLDRSSFKGDNREFDGRVSVHNMNDFLKTYETMSATGQNQWPYTEKNAQFVRDLLDFKYPELTGPNFAGFSARALCRRAGLTRMHVRSYSDYAALATAWKQATQEDASFREDVQASQAGRGDQPVGDSTPCGRAGEVSQPALTSTERPGDVPPQSDSPSKPPCDVPPQVVAPSQPPCDVPPPPPCDVPPPPAQPPCDLPPVQTTTTNPCDLSGEAAKAAQSIREHDQHMRELLVQMSTFEKGGSYWRMANRFLHAGMTPCDRDDISNRDVERLTKSFLQLNHATVDKRGLPNPMVHPGDRVPVPEHLAELAARHEKLARALERMMLSDQ